MDRPVVVCGLGKVGRRVVAFLRAAGVPVVAVDARADPADPKLAGLAVVRGDGRDADVLARAGVAAARGVVIVTGDDLVNLSVALTARRLNGDAPVVVRMFNQTLLARLGDAVRNMTALSVSALTAPLLALLAVTGDGLGAFRVAAGPQQIAEATIAAGGKFAGRPLTLLAADRHLLVLAHYPADGPPRLIHEVDGNAVVRPGDRVVVCGAPADVAPLLAFDRGEFDPGVRWAGRLRRGWRAAATAVAAVDRPVLAMTGVLAAVVAASTLTFRYGFAEPWSQAFYETVSVIATGAELPGKDAAGWRKAFVGGLKLFGAALLAGFTAVVTNYLLRAKLAGALEARRIPDGGHVVVCGLGNIGYRCVEELGRMGVPAVAVEKAADNPLAPTVRRMGVPVVVGDATVAQTLRQARAGTARAVIAATDAELANLEIALLVRQENPAQRVVVRLTDPDFAQAVREAADIRLAVAAPAVAAPAFVAALFGDRVHALVAAAGDTLAVVELTVRPDDPCLNGTPLVAAMVDYRFVPVAVGADEPFASAGIPRTYRLKPGDAVTVVVGVADLDRLLRREPAPADWAVDVDAHPALANGELATLVRAARGCSREEADELVKAAQFRAAGGLTRGQAGELKARLDRERVTARVVKAGPPPAAAPAAVPLP